MEEKTVYVKQNGATLLICPKCNFSKEIRDEQTKDGSKRVRVRCRCGHTFYVRFEFRKYYRKKTALVGYYATRPDYDNWVEITVMNISMGGIGFHASDRPRVKTGDEIEVKFRLDDANQSEIQNRAVVKVVLDRYIGCEFQALLNGYKKRLGFYLNVF
jgi:hypothetical protein